MRPKHNSPFIYYLVVDCDGNPIDNPSCSVPETRHDHPDDAVRTAVHVVRKIWEDYEEGQILGVLDGGTLAPLFRFHRAGPPGSTFPIDPEDPEDNRAPDGWIEIQRDDSPDAPPGETWHLLPGDDDAALAVCPHTACLYHCETGQLALLSDEEACKALPESGPAICIVPRAIARARYAEIDVKIS